MIHYEASTNCYVRSYYKSQNEAKDACDWKGSAVITEASAVDKGCNDKLASASASATAASSSNFATPIPMGRLFSMGEMAVGLYVVVAMGVGACVLVL